MDFDLMDGLLKDMENYSLHEDDEKRIEEIKALLLEMNWDEIKDKAEEECNHE